MLYTEQDIFDYIEQEDVKFIRLAFCDPSGRQKNISIMPQELPRAFSQGISFDASAIPGFGCAVNSDLFLFPIPSTLSVLPWRPSTGKVVRMFCRIKHPDGTPFPLDSRWILEKAVKAAAAQGLSLFFGSEFEFYLFKTDENGKRTYEPYDTAGYMDIAPEDKGENVRRAICLTLEQMGIIPESSHHESGPGQNEIDFRYSDPLSAADNAITFRSVVKTIAAANGLYADFSPKPLEGKPGSGFYINISVKGDGEQEKFPYIIGGIMDKIKDMTAFLNPDELSYKRLGNCKAPKYISWSNENRSQLIRVPVAENENKRAELRSPDGTANPYLAFALLIYAAMHGIENKLTPPPASNINLFAAPAKVLADFDTLPESLEDAGNIATESEFIASHLPSSIIKAYGR